MLKSRSRQVPVGTIAYIQDDHRPIGRTMQAALALGRKACRNPWIVVAWLNREYAAARKVDGRYISTFCRGGHLAIVQSLRDGRTATVADWILLQCEDSGLTKS